jgi:hypothetical protein
MENPNTPKEEVVENNILTDNEKNYLENYKGENNFLKSLSDNYKEKSTLSEKQILALRKSQEEESNRLSRCPHTDLDYNQVCRFSDKRFEDSCDVKIVSIRPKALCLLDEKKNRKAWVPSKALNKELIIDNDSGEELIEITLKEWFTRDDGFWKENVPYTPKSNSDEKVKPEQQTNIESVKDDFKEQVEEMYKEEDEDDGLPF